MISLTIVFIGLTILFFYSESINLNRIYQIEEDNLQEQVIAEGEIEKITQTDNVIFLKLKALREEQMDVIVFEDEDLYLNEGDLIEISGMTEEYNGKKEIIASRVILKGS